MHIQNVIINGEGCANPGTFFWPLYIKGSDTVVLPGWRAGTIENVNIFNGEVGSAWISGAMSFRLHVNTFRGSGFAPAAVYFTGTALAPSNNVFVTGHIEGRLIVQANVFNLVTLLY